MARRIELIDLAKKKEAQMLYDISLTPSQRFVRMFDLIEFCILFSKEKKVPKGFFSSPSATCLFNWVKCAHDM